MMKADPIGLYVHIPFCVRKCAYCDFCSYPYSDISWREDYIHRLCAEISEYEGRNIKVNSIFFGGGTPSLLKEAEFRYIVGAIKKSFMISADAEFTIEANPKTLTEKNLASYIDCGVNRISIGLQSIHENELKSLGRIHNYTDFLDSYNLVRSLGIDNINVDLMYGIPEQTKESFAETLDSLIELAPEHISVYGLILEEGTPLYKNRDALTLPSEDAECDMYYIASQKLSLAGYSHYEISNYAKLGYECRHNLKYWRCEEYIGVGVNAHSYFDGIRFANSDDISEYLDVKCKKYITEDISDSTDEAYEYVMLRLRLAEGLSLSDYYLRFGENFLEGRGPMIDKLRGLGYIGIQNDRLFLTEKGFYVSNAILCELI